MDLKNLASVGWASALDPRLYRHLILKSANLKFSSLSAPELLCIMKNPLSSLSASDDYKLLKPNFGSEFLQLILLMKDK